MSDIPYLSADDLEALNLSTPEIVDAIEQAILGATEGRVFAAPKAVITPEGDPRYMMAALAAMDAPDVLAVKTVVLNPENSAKDLPQINGLVTLLDSQTGLPLAILDGNWVTAIRTAALSAYAARHLALPHAEVLGVFGTGVQARSHLRLFADMFPLKRLMMWGRGQANKDRLRADAEALGLTVENAADPGAILAGADVVVTSITHTSCPAPFLHAGNLKRGAMLCSVDLGAPWETESFRSLDTLIIDDLAQEAALPNKLAPAEAVDGDLTSLATGRHPGRKRPSDRTGFVFRGHALGDIALSALAWTRARSG
ncbi:MAG: ornithine cyclodeaminase family protein [Shimia sp.]